MNDQFFDPRIPGGEPPQPSWADSGLLTPVNPSAPEERGEAAPSASPEGPAPEKAAADAAEAPTSEPQEVVEYYPPLPAVREVVEIYVQPRRMPGRAALPDLSGKTAAAPLRSGPAAASERKAHSRKGLWIFLVCLAAVSALSVGALFMNGGFSRAVPPDVDAEYQQNEDWNTEEVSIAPYPFGQGAVMDLSPTHGKALTVQEIYRLVNPAVVTVMAQLDYGASVGTGVIFREDGYVLTNYHVVTLQSVPPATTW